MKQRGVFLTDGRDSRFSRFYRRLFDQQLDCDVTFYSENGCDTIKAHLNVLNEYSMYFAANCGKQYRKPINVYFTGVPFDLIRRILRIIYHRSDKISEGKIDMLYTASQFLGVDIYFEPSKESVQHISWWLGGSESSDDEEKTCSMDGSPDECSDFTISRRALDSIVDAQDCRPLTRSMSMGKDSAMNESSKQGMGRYTQNATMPIDVDKFCFNCRKEFASGKNLKRHMALKHADEPKESCSICPFAGTVESLVYHYANIHNLSIILTTGGKRKRTENSITQPRPKKSRTGSGI